MLYNVLGKIRSFPNTATPELLTPRVCLRLKIAIHRTGKPPSHSATPDFFVCICGLKSLLAELAQAFFDRVQCFVSVDSFGGCRNLFSLTDVCRLYTHYSEPLRPFPL